MFDSLIIAEIVCYAIIVVILVIILKLAVGPLNKFMEDINPLRHRREISKLWYKFTELNFEMALLRGEIKTLKSRLEKYEQEHKL